MENRFSMGLKMSNVENQALGIPWGTLSGQPTRLETKQTSAIFAQSKNSRNESERGFEPLPKCLKNFLGPPRTELKYAQKSDTVD